MDFGVLGEKEVFRLLNSSDIGLNDIESKKRLQKLGLNEIVEKKENKVFDILKEQVNNIVVYILFGAVVISAFLKEYIDASAILILLIINIVLGFIQDFKAEKAIENLKKLSITQVKVLRNKQKQVIDSKFLVDGDIIFLESGDKIPTDCYLLETNELKVDESIFTGESR